MEINLKPCPFCGDSPAIRYSNLKWIILCCNPKCRIQPMTDYHRYRAVVVREWNRRASEEP